ncbi:hypothetical protein N0V83_009673 [Neocucurbitaria cava]|uniref:SET domain-containing protein n=1 Tax=Neocucurbitaria cava TaxID=798079 RepID=A0A9W8XZS3_9PLEO|nr:hypothetical protein N0V83_009673 [Neocucurbitaria cava]
MGPNHSVEIPNWVDLTEGKESEVNSDSDSSHTAVADSEQASGSVKKKKKNRKGRGKRGGKRKGKQAKQQTSEETDETDAMLTPTSTPRSDATVSTVSLSESVKKKLMDKKSAGINYVYVPVVPHYERRIVPSNSDNNTPGKSTIEVEKHGLFATEDIEHGTRIICEPALITLPTQGHGIKELMSAFAKLSKDDQEAMWKMDPSDFSASPLLTALANIADPLVDRACQLLDIPEASRTQEQSAELQDVGRVLEHALPTLRIAARWHAHCRPVTTVPQTNWSTLPGNTPVLGVFALTAQLRHSCVPNCYAHYNATSARITVHATRPIPRGDELTLSAIPSIYYQSATDRAAELLNKYALKCTCEACDPAHPKFKAHEEARMRATARAILLDNFLTVLEVVDSNKALRALHLPISYRPEREPAKDELADMILSLQELLSDLAATGAEAGVETMRWSNVLVDRLLPRFAEACRDCGEKEKGEAAWKAVVGRARLVVVLGEVLWGIVRSLLRG